MTWQPGRKIDEPVLSAALTSTNTLVATTKGRLRGLYCRSAGTAGTIVIKDGGASGTTLVTIDTPAAIGGFYVDIPGSGISFKTDLHATLTTADGVTAFYAVDYNPLA